MPRRVYVLVTAATLAGAFLRLWQLTDVPPGLHYDLAATALLGEDVAFHGYRPIFISAFTGHEVLFYYWLAAWFNLIGSSVFTLRLAAALLGVLTLPATFFAVREVLGAESEAWQSAAYAAVLLAFAFFHVTFSRFGFRVIAQPLVQALALGFLFRGLRRLLRPWPPSPAGDQRLSAFSRGPLPFAHPLVLRGLLSLALAGVFTGLAAYTYLSARFFPFPLAVMWVALLVPALRRPALASCGAAPAHSPALRPRSLGLWTLGFGIFFFSALLTFAPLGLYFLQHPEDFINRAAQVLPQPGQAALVWEGLRGAAELLFIRGEPYARYNLPGLPLFGFPLGLFFGLGWLITLRQALAGQRSALARAAEWLLLAWLPFMLLPTALSVREIFPSTIRALGVAPLAAVFPARGLLAAYRWLQRRSPGPLLPTAYPVSVLGAVILAAGVSVTYRDYFVSWAGLRTQRLDNDADLAGIAAYLNDQDLAGVTPYVTAIHYRHPTLAYLARDFETVRWLTGGRSLALPRDRAALYLVAASAPLPEAWTAGWGLHLAYQQPGPDNQPEFQAFRFAAGEAPPLPAFAPLDENFGNAAFLTGARLSADEAAVTVDLRWRVENPVETGDFLPYVRLYDSAGRAWAQGLDYTYPSEQWAAGDLLLTRLLIPLPAGLPAGDYTVKAGLFSASTGASLPRLDARGGFGGERAVAGALRLAGGPPATEAEFRAANTIQPPGSPGDLPGGVALLGYRLEAGTLRPNERFELTLYWRAPTPAELDFEVWLDENRLAAERASIRDVLLTRLNLRVPLAQPAGPARLRVTAPGRGSVDLGEVAVAPTERAFTLPDVAKPRPAEFGDGLIRLAGYTLQPGAETRLRLVWQAGAGLIGQDYTVFVHIKDAAGGIVAQADGPPRGGAYPTSLWAPGEYVADDYAFALPQGNYSVWAGLYEAETGRRLMTVDAGAPADQVYLTELNVP